MIKRAQRSELTHVEREELVYRGGTDLQGRPSLILVASRIHAACGSELEAAEGTPRARVEERRTERRTATALERRSERRLATAQGAADIEVADAAAIARTQGQL
ncbi:hypothetical protein Ctob_013189 [Chrysochromulina tobinii]|uniref:Uncharacterized protein n=1 Tax=Chrysochromulina tobinii TaxID=1460289 RepID=A0A0M0JW62_9EUKA|nr:hypothetical protein Ctob_006085 [Chrysochromulina tobinii]KOO30819.1 hypothetical protein Ctob_013189 [Chrysochromulina tobinii]|eukprot:KOO24268.1 hypothetical protein Ctob_006085 [Chrysochromulina sp. CCMP291]